VQSSTLCGRQLTARIEAFLSEVFLPELETMSEEEFASYKEGLIERKLEPDQRLTSQAGRFWAEINTANALRGVKETYPVFDRRQREAEALRKLTRADLLQFSKEFLLPEGNARRLLVSQVSSRKAIEGQSDQDSDSLEKLYSYKEITDGLLFAKIQPKI
jgi:secreted Zn-dependent insulinase-like peptidase